MALENTKSLIRSCVVSTKKGLKIQQLERKYGLALTGQTASTVLIYGDCISIYCQFQFIFMNNSASVFSCACLYINMNSINLFIQSKIDKTYYDWIGL